MYGANMKIGLNVLWHSTGFQSGLSVFVNSVCLLVRVTLVDKNKERSIRFNESKIRLSLIHFGRLSVVRLTEQTVGFPDGTAQFTV
jgi:hypothetical protein